MKQHSQASLQRGAFLFSLSQTGNFTISADFAGLSVRELRDNAESDSDFAKAIDMAFVEACDRLLFVAFERAVKGVVIPHFYQGEEIGKTRRPSDNLLRFLLDRAAQAENKGHDASENEADYERLRATLGKRLAQFTAEDEPCPTPNMAE